MTKNELIKAAAIKAGYTQETAAAIINAAFDAVTDALAAGDNITLYQFGKLERRQRKERKAYNYLTGATITTAASVNVGFVPAKALKDRLNAERGK